MQLQNKVIIVTGSSEGIGEQVALRLAKDGAKLALIARNLEKLKEVQKQAQKIGSPQVEIYSCDICNTRAINTTVSAINKDFGWIDILINNAGIWQKMMQLDEIETSTIDSVIQTNLTGVIHMTHQVLPLLRQTKESAIINIISQSGVVSQDGQSVYTATKFGIRGFTDVLKKDLKGTQVRVAWVYQAGTNTKMFENTGETMPIENFTDPADLADVIAYMLGLPPKIWMHDVRVCY